MKSVQIYQICKHRRVLSTRKESAVGYSLEDALMVFNDIDVICVTETNEELLIFDVSDDVLERAVRVVEGGNYNVNVFLRVFENERSNSFGR